MMRRWPRPAADDSGASLFIALAFVAFVGLVAGALLTFGGTSIRGASSTQYRADVVYDVDGALQAGVTQVRHGTFVNDPSGEECDAKPSDGATRVLQYTGANVGTNNTVAVTCEGGPGTGMAGAAVPVSNSNRPGQALLVLGQEADSLSFEGNKTLNIKGKVHVNGGTAISSGSSGAINVLNSQFIGRESDNACDVSITSTPPANCNLSNPIVGDPGTAAANPTDYQDYDLPLPVGQLVKAPVPACPTDGSRIVTLSPGLYDDYTELNNLTASNCAAHTIWFQPGTYYFDFRNGTETSDRIWRIADDAVRVIAGKYQGWTPATVSDLGPTIPGACVNPALSDASAQGVAFVFGGTSRLSVERGQLEVCGQYYTAKPPIAIYGAKNDIGSSSPVTPATPGVPDGTGPAPSGMIAFANPNRVVAGSGATATDSDSARAHVVTAAGPGASAGIILGNFGTTPLVPAGATLTSARLVVNHKETANSGGLTNSNPLSVTVRPKRAGVTGTQISTGLSVSAAYAEHQVDLLPVLRGEAYRYGLQNGIEVQYVGNVRNNSNVQLFLDSVRLELTWTPPSFRAQSGCVASAGCSVITTSQSPDVLAFFQGTTYMPNNKLDIALNNDTGQVFRWGLIVRTIALKMTASFRSTDPVIEVPDFSNGRPPTDVYFKAYICPDGGCTVSGNTLSGPWRLAGSARVSYTDDDVLNPSTTGRRGVDVKSWTSRTRDS